LFISSANRDGHRDFLIIVPYKYSYLLTGEFLVDNIYGSSINNTREVEFY